MHSESIEEQLPSGQAWLIDRIQKAGYGGDIAGMCFGVANMLKQAILARDVQTFNKRLHLIYSIPLESFDTRIEEERQKLISLIAKTKRETLLEMEKEFNKILNENELSREQKKILNKRIQEKIKNAPEHAYIDILAFFEGIELYQNPAFYPELLDETKRPLTQNREPMAWIVAPKILEDEKKISDQDAILTVKNFSGVYNLEELKLYLKTINKIFKKEKPPINYPVSFVLGNTRHAIAFGYDPEQGLIFGDANQLPPQPISEDELAEKIFSAFNCEKHVIFSTELSVSQSNYADMQKRIALLEAETDWKNIHAVTPEKTHLADPNDISWLLIATYNNDYETVEMLLEKSANPNQKDKRGFSALYWAVYWGNKKMVAKLLEKGADPNMPSKEQFPLGVAISNQHYAVVDLLIEKNANPNIMLSNGTTPLLLAVINGHLDTVKKLIAKGADLNKTYQNLTALEIAKKNNNTEMANYIQLIMERQEHFFTAVSTGSIEDVKFLLQNGANPQLLKNGMTTLHIAIQNGHPKVVQELLKHNVDPNQPSQNGETPLFVAIQYGDPNIVKILLENKANPNQEYNNMNPAEFAFENQQYEISELIQSTVELQINLYIATQDGNFDLVTKFLENKLYPDIMLNGSTPLLVAAKLGHHAIVDKLLAAHASAKLTNQDGETPFYLAALHGHLLAVEKLIKSSDIHAVNKNGESALYGATKNKHSKTIEILLANGANPNQVTKTGEAPLFAAIRNGDIAAVKILLKNRADPHQNCNGLSPFEHAQQQKNSAIIEIIMETIALQKQLYTAAREGNVGAVKKLLQKGLYPDIEIKKGVTPLLMAAQNNHLEIVQALLESGSNLNIQEKNGHSPLSLAVQQRHISVVQVLLENGANPNINLKDGTTPLSIAVESGELEIVKKLHQYKANFNKEIQTKDGPMPLLHFAIQSGQPAIVKFLLENGAPPGQQANGKTPLEIAENLALTEPNPAKIIKRMLTQKLTEKLNHLLLEAIQNGNLEDIKKLLKNGANVNYLTATGDTPLIRAIKKGSIDIIIELLNNKADINLTDQNQLTPLMLAINESQTELVKLLLQKGANPNIPNKSNAYPLFAAVSKRNKEIVSLLLEYDANPNPNVRPSLQPLQAAERKGIKEITQMIEAAIKKEKKASLSNVITMFSHPKQEPDIKKEPSSFTMKKTT